MNQRNQINQKNQISQTNQRDQTNQNVFHPPSSIFNPPQTLFCGFVQQFDLQLKLPDLLLEGGHQLIEPGQIAFQADPMDLSGIQILKVDPVLFLKHPPEPLPILLEDDVTGIVTVGLDITFDIEFILGIGRLYSDITEQVGLDRVVALPNLDKVAMDLKDINCSLIIDIVSQDDVVLITVIARHDHQSVAIGGLTGGAVVLDEDETVVALSDPDKFDTTLIRTGIG